MHRRPLILLEQHLGARQDTCGCLAAPVLRHLGRSCRLTTSQGKEVLSTVKNYALQSRFTLQKNCFRLRKETGKETNNPAFIKHLFFFFYLKTLYRHYTATASPYRSMQISKWRKVCSAFRCRIWGWDFVCLVLVLVRISICGVKISVLYYGI